MSCSKNGGRNGCKPGEKPVPVSWPQDCLTYRVNGEGTSKFDYSTVDEDPSNAGERLNVLRRLTAESFRTWSSVPCTDLYFVEGPVTDQTRAVVDRQAGRDENINLIVWKDDKLPVYMNSATVANTTISVKGREIVDADIEFNSVSHEFANLDQSGGNRYDFKNVLVHEIGHLVGLGHSSVRGSTMQTHAVPGEIKKRRLHSDDKKGICHLFPANDRGSVCYDSPGVNASEGCGGCHQSPSNSSVNLVWIGLVFIFGWRFYLRDFSQ